MIASAERRQALCRALLWSHALAEQIDRLYADRTAATEGQAKVRSAEFYGHQDAWPFYMMDADKHFAMVAARQLLRALKAFDQNDRLPAMMPQIDVRLVRDALEHWDEPTGRANTQMAERGADPNAHTWRPNGHGVLGDVIEDSALRFWAISVYEELVEWDPW